MGKQYLTNYECEDDEAENLEDQLVDNMMMAGSIFSQDNIQMAYL